MYHCQHTHNLKNVMRRERKSIEFFWLLPNMILDIQLHVLYTRSSTHRHTPETQREVRLCEVSKKEEKKTNRMMFACDIGAQMRANIV